MGEYDGEGACGSVVRPGEGQEERAPKLNEGFETGFDGWSR
jgi:hypothetical protein